MRLHKDKLEQVFYLKGFIIDANFNINRCAERTLLFDVQTCHPFANGFVGSCSFRKEPARLAITYSKACSLALQLRKAIAIYFSSVTSIANT